MSPGMVPVRAQAPEEWATEPAGAWSRQAGTRETRAGRGCKGERTIRRRAADPGTRSLPTRLRSSPRGLRPARLPLRGIGEKRERHPLIGREARDAAAPARKDL